MTKNLLSSLLVGAAITLVSTPAIAQAQECVWADAKIYGTYEVSKPIPAEALVSGLYKTTKYTQYHRYCNFDQFKAKFFADNGGAVEAYGQGSVLIVPVPVRLDEASPAPAPTPAPTPTQQPVSTNGAPGSTIDAQIADLYSRVNGSGNPAEIEVLKAQIAALEARQSTTQSTRVVEKPVYTTKTIVQGPTAAQLKRLSDLETKVAKGEMLTPEQLEELQKLRKDVNRLSNTASDHETRLTNAEKAIAFLKASTADIPWYAWVMMVLGTIGFLLSLLNHFRKAERTETREDRDNVGHLAQRQYQVEFDPSDFEQQLHEKKTGEILVVKMSGIGGDATAYCTKLRFGRVEVAGNEANPIDISRLRFYLSQRYNDGGFGA